VTNATVASNGIAGLQVRKVEDVRVEDSRLFGNAGDAVSLDQTTRAQVVGNVAWNNSYAIDLAGDEMRVAGNELRNSSTHAVSVSSGSNTVENNTVTGGFGGIAIGPGTQTLVHNNTLENVERGISTGRGEDRVTGNTLRNVGLGILVKTHGIAEDNLVQGASTGIEPWDRAEAVDNRIEDAWQGLQLERSRDSLASENEIQRSSGDGIGVSDGEGGNVVANNTVNASGDHGVEVPWSTDTRVANNTVTASGEEGVRIATSDDTDVVDNVVEDNEDDAFYVRSSDGIRPLHNRATGNEGRASACRLDCWTHVAQALAPA